MDNSQSSDCFPESTDTSFISHVPMDTITYESLVANTKQALSIDDERKIQNTNFSTYFATLLEDCSICIIQSLDLVIEILSDTQASITKLTEYLNDAVCLLQMLSDFMKTVIESMSIACCSMKTFPTTTGLIIITVFTHCKDSESLYGKNLSSVEKQLKDLFRNCHELQLAYLKVLEKHYIFDLTEKEEKDVLIEALDINLKIGEIVQSLDVKTMAEQWKAYTAICEKYSAVLTETNVFQDCTLVLCMLIRTNINTAKNQDEKVVMRSLKVASFTIKILLKTCTIFRQATGNDFSDVLDLMFFIQTSFLSHLGLTADRSQFTNLVVIPSECLLKELLSHEMFCNNLLSFDVETIENENRFLGFLLIIISAVKCLTQGHKSKTITKSKLIDCVFTILPFIPVLTNLNHPFKSELNQVGTHGFFEHLLIGTASLAFTLSSEEFSMLEKHMAEAILSTDCCSALFSANLWVLLARHVSPQLLFNQIVWLCTMYKKLENHKMFHRSPQKVHLTYTITRLFEVMENDDKMKICKQFRIHDDDNISLWGALGVNSLPEDAKSAAEEVVAEKLMKQFQCLNSSKGPEAISKLTTILRLAATCSFTNTKGIEDCIMAAWSKTCPKHNFTVQELESGTVWFYDYLQALITLTDSLWNRLFVRSAYLIKVFHIIFVLVQQCGTEFKLILINTLCKLASCDICESELVDANFTAFTCLLQHTEDIVRNKLFNTLKQYKRDKNIDRILSHIEDSQESCSNIKDKQNYALNDLKSMNYSHKCFESRNMIVLSSSSGGSDLKKASSCNFDFDLDNLFDNDSDSEPMSKKVKLDVNEAEAIVERLENDAALLCAVKENVFTAENKNRIQNVCEKLRNILH